MPTSQSYGYELQKLLDRYNLTSPVAPRLPVAAPAPAALTTTVEPYSGGSGSVFRRAASVSASPDPVEVAAPTPVVEQPDPAQVDTIRRERQIYQDKLAGTPMYNTPYGGSQAYQDLLRRVQYGDVNRYISGNNVLSTQDPARTLYDASYRFGWSAPQIEQARGWSPGAVVGYTNRLELPPIRAFKNGGLNTDEDRITPMSVPSSESSTGPHNLTPYPATLTAGTPPTLPDPVDFYAPPGTAGRGTLSLGAPKLLASRPSVLPGAAFDLDVATPQPADLSWIEQELAGWGKPTIPPVDPNFSCQNFDGTDGDSCYAQARKIRNPDGTTTLQLPELVVTGEPLPGETTVTRSPGEITHPLIQMLGKYSDPPGLKQQGDLLATKRKEFGDYLRASLTQPEEADKSELYFRLAAAFASPGKTGHFSEGAGQAATVMADWKKEGRQLKEAHRKEKVQTELAIRKLDLDEMSEELKTKRTEHSEQQKERREIIKGIITEYITSGKPQSEAGRIAKDMGLMPGTAEYQSEVSRQASLIVQKQTAQLEAIAAGISSQAATQAATERRLALEGRRDARAEQKEAREEKRLTPAEIKLADDAEQSLASTNRALSMMNQALTYVNKAFTGSLGDKAQYHGLSVATPSNARVVATEQLEQILTKSGLEGLRAAFGGNPTEGERAIALLTQGLNATSVASRTEIINRVIGMLKEQSAQQDKKLKEITSGQYGIKR